MFNGLAITFLFLFCVVTQTSLIQSWPDNFSFFPLHLIVGLLVMHRYDPVIGSLWFVLTIPLAVWCFQPGSAWSYFGIAIISYFLMKRLFTTRSIYALVGLGLTVSNLYLLINFLLSHLHLNSTQIFIFELEILIGLFIGNIFSNYWQRFLSRWIYVRSI